MTNVQERQNSLFSDPLLGLMPSPVASPVPSAVDPVTTTVTKWLTSATMEMGSEIDYVIGRPSNANANHFPNEKKKKKGRGRGPSLFTESERNLLELQSNKDFRDLAVVRDIKTEASRGTATRSSSKPDACFPPILSEPSKSYSCHDLGIQANPDSPSNQFVIGATKERNLPPTDRFSSATVYIDLSEQFEKEALKSMEDSVGTPSHPYSLTLDEKEISVAKGKRRLETDSTDNQSETQKRAKVSEKFTERCASAPPALAASTPPSDVPPVATPSLSLSALMKVGWEMLNIPPEITRSAVKSELFSGSPNINQPSVSIQPSRFSLSRYLVCLSQALSRSAALRSSGSTETELVDTHTPFRSEIQSFLDTPFVNNASFSPLLSSPAVEETLSEHLLRSLPFYLSPFAAFQAQSWAAWPDRELDGTLDLRQGMPGFLHKIVRGEGTLESLGEVLRLVLADIFIYGVFEELERRAKMQIEMEAEDVVKERERNIKPSMNDHKPSCGKTKSTAIGIIKLLFQRSCLNNEHNKVASQDQSPRFPLPSEYLDEIRERIDKNLEQWRSVLGKEEKTISVSKAFDLKVGAASSTFSLTVKHCISMITFCGFQIEQKKMGFRLLEKMITKPSDEAGPEFSMPSKVYSEGLESLLRWIQDEKLKKPTFSSLLFNCKRVKEKETLYENEEHTVSIAVRALQFTWAQLHPQEQITHILLLNDSIETCFEGIKYGHHNGIGGPPHARLDSPTSLIIPGTHQNCEDSSMSEGTRRTSNTLVVTTTARPAPQRNLVSTSKNFLQFVNIFQNITRMQQKYCDKTTLKQSANCPWSEFYRATREIMLLFYSPFGLLSKVHREELGLSRLVMTPLARTLHLGYDSSPSRGFKCCDHLPGPTRYSCYQCQILGQKSMKIARDLPEYGVFDALTYGVLDTNGIDSSIGLENDSNRESASQGKKTSRLRLSPLLIHALEELSAELSKLHREVSFFSAESYGQTNMNAPRARILQLSYGLEKELKEVEHILQTMRLMFPNKAPRKKFGADDYHNSAKSSSRSLELHQDQLIVQAQLEQCKTHRDLLFFCDENVRKQESLSRCSFEDEAPPGCAREGNREAVEARIESVHYFSSGPHQNEGISIPSTISACFSPVDALSPPTQSIYDSMSLLTSKLGKLHTDAARHFDTLQSLEKELVQFEQDREERKVREHCRKEEQEGRLQRILAKLISFRRLLVPFSKALAIEVDAQSEEHGGVAEDHEEKSEGAPVEAENEETLPILAISPVSPVMRRFPTPTSRLYNEVTEDDHSNSIVDTGIFLYPEALVAMQDLGAEATEQNFIENLDELLEEAERDVEELEKDALEEEIEGIEDKHPQLDKESVDRNNAICSYSTSASRSGASEKEHHTSASAMLDIETECIRELLEDSKIESHFVPTLSSTELYVRKDISTRISQVQELFSTYFKNNGKDTFDSPGSITLQELCFPTLQPSLQILFKLRRTITSIAFLSPPVAVFVASSASFRGKVSSLLEPFRIEEKVKKASKEFLDRKDKGDLSHAVPSFASLISGIFKAVRKLYHCLYPVAFPDIIILLGDSLLSHGASFLPTLVLASIVVHYYPLAAEDLLFLDYKAKPKSKQGKNCRQKEEEKQRFHRDSLWLISQLKPGRFARGASSPARSVHSEKGPKDDLFGFDTDSELDFSGESGEDNEEEEKPVGFSDQTSSVTSPSCSLSHGNVSTVLTQLGGGSDGTLGTISAPTSVRSREHAEMQQFTPGPLTPPKKSGGEKYLRGARENKKNFGGLPSASLSWYEIETNYLSIVSRKEKNLASLEQYFRTFSDTRAELLRKIRQGVALGEDLRHQISQIEVEILQFCLHKQKEGNESEQGGKGISEASQGVFQNALFTNEYERNANLSTERDVEQDSEDESQSLKYDANFDLAEDTIAALEAGPLQILQGMLQQTQRKYRRTLARVRETVQKKEMLALDFREKLNIAEREYISLLDTIRATKISSELSVHKPNQASAFSRESSKETRTKNGKKTTSIKKETEKKKGFVKGIPTGLTEKNPHSSFASVKYLGASKSTVRLTLKPKMETQDRAQSLPPRPPSGPAVPSLPGVAPQTTSEKTSYFTHSSSSAFQPTPKELPFSLSLQRFYILFESVEFLRVAIKVVHGEAFTWPCFPDKARVLHLSQDILDKSVSQRIAETTHLKACKIMALQRKTTEDISRSFSARLGKIVKEGSSKELVQRKVDLYRHYFEAMMGIPQKYTTTALFDWEGYGVEVQQDQKPDSQCDAKVQQKPKRPLDNIVSKIPSPGSKEKSVVKPLLESFDPPTILSSSISSKKALYRTLASHMDERKAPLLRQSSLKMDIFGLHAGFPGLESGAVRYPELISGPGNLATARHLRTGTRSIFRKLTSFEGHKLLDRQVELTQEKDKKDKKDKEQRRQRRGRRRNLRNWESQFSRANSRTQSPSPGPTEESNGDTLSYERMGVGGLGKGKKLFYAPTQDSSEEEEEEEEKTESVADGDKERVEESKESLRDENSDEEDGDGECEGLSSHSHDDYSDSIVASVGKVSTECSIPTTVVSKKPKNTTTLKRTKLSQRSKNGALATTFSTPFYHVPVDIALFLSQYVLCPLLPGFATKKAPNDNGTTEESATKALVDPVNHVFLVSLNNMLRKTELAPQRNRENNGAATHLSEAIFGSIGQALRRKAVKDWIKHPETGLAASLLFSLSQPRLLYNLRRNAKKEQRNTNVKSRSPTFAIPFCAPLGLEKAAEKAEFAGFLRELRTTNTFASRSFSPHFSVDDVNDVSNVNDVNADDTALRDISAFLVTALGVLVDEFNSELAGLYKESVAHTSPCSTLSVLESLQKTQTDFEFRHNTPFLSSESKVYDSLVKSVLRNYVDRDALLQGMQSEAVTLLPEIIHRRGFGLPTFLNLASPTSLSWQRVEMFNARSIVLGSESKLTTDFLRELFSHPLRRLNSLSSAVPRDERPSTVHLISKPVHVVPRIQSTHQKIHPYNELRDLGMRNTLYHLDTGVGSAYFANYEEWVRIREEISRRKRENTRVEGEFSPQPHSSSSLCSTPHHATLGEYQGCFRQISLSEFIESNVTESMNELLFPPPRRLSHAEMKDTNSTFTFDKASNTFLNDEQEQNNSGERIPWNGIHLKHLQRKLLASNPDFCAIPRLLRNNTSESDTASVRVEETLQYLSNDELFRRLEEKKRALEQMQVDFEFIGSKTSVTYLSTIAQEVDIDLAEGLSENGGETDEMPATSNSSCGITENTPLSSGNPVSLTGIQRHRKQLNRKKDQMKGALKRTLWGRGEVDQRVVKESGVQYTQNFVRTFIGKKQKITHCFLGNQKKK